MLYYAKGCMCAALTHLVNAVGYFVHERQSPLSDLEYHGPVKHLLGIPARTDQMIEDYVCIT